MSDDERSEHHYNCLHPQTAQNKHDEHMNRRRLSRSPHPYHRRGSSLVPGAEEPRDEAVRDLEPAEGIKPDDTEDAEKHGYTRYRTPWSRSPSDSGTEGDEENFNYVKALPAAPIPPRKGLRDGTDFKDGAFTPLLTPQVDQDVLQTNQSYFDAKSRNVDKPAKAEDTDGAKDKFRQARLREYLRRDSEGLSLCFISCIVLSNPVAFDCAFAKRHELILFAILIIVLYLLYPVRTLLGPLWSERKVKLGRVHVPAAFDPAALFYPEVLPILTALSLSDSHPSSVTLNIVLGLASLPGPIVPQLGSHQDGNPLHWALTCLPLSAPYFNLDHLLPASIAAGKSTEISSLPGELLCAAYPLHQALVKTIHYLTTSSLLFSEVQLLSIALINLLLLSQSPQAQILTSIIWIGSIGLLVVCRHVLSWNVALERIPSWKFQRTRQVIQATNRFMGRKRNYSVDVARPLSESFEQVPILNDQNRRSLHATSQSAHFESFSNTELRSNGSLQNGGITLDLKRWQTAPAEPDSPTMSPITPTRSRRRDSSSSILNSYLTMTTKQIERRKWFYSVYTITASLAIILIPIRFAVSAVLSGQDPFSWAATYLFGQLPHFEKLVYDAQLQPYVYPPPPLPETCKSLRCSRGWLDMNRIWFIGEANTRLLLFGYWAATIAFGLACVFKLSAVAEVDTRRKVFHGMMVAMLLPTAYVDPAFLSLGLALVLSIFLLLDLFRASQLRPLSRPLARFLTPYVDGRDLRGPVVVSHIFLLIGCAIPFWLSLAGIKRSGRGQWAGWDVETRDLSMVAGVVCVGMGDAAASLVGRRIGRRKWPWAGGKSLEGSAAFAGAVMVGLLFGKMWLRLGRWPTTYGVDYESWFTVVGKAGIAAMSASFTEAVLTGCNDNVVVPIILWLLVRGLRL